MRTRITFPVIMMLILCGSCATMDPVIPPEATIATARFENLTLFETRSVFTLRLSNENPFPLAVDGGVFSVDLNGITIGKGMSGECVQIPRLSTATVEVPVHVSNIRLLFNVPAITQSGQIEYVVRSTVYMMSEGRRRSLKAESTGTFMLPVRERDALASLGAAFGSGPGDTWGR